MTLDYCPVVNEFENGANWCCNLLAGHPGRHDDGLGDEWDSPISQPGPDRRCVAAVNIIGSWRAVDELHTALAGVYGEGRAQEGLEGIRDLLLRWRGDPS